MIRVKSRPKENYKNFKSFYSSWELGNRSFYYYEKDGKDFMYIHDLKTFIIPSENDLTLEEILKETEIDYSNWVFSKIDDKLPYTKNQFKLASTEDLFSDISDIDYVKLKSSNQLSGTWELKNTDDKSISMDFSILLSDFTFYLGFKEKTEVPYNRSKVIRKSIFISTLMKIKNICQIR